MNVIKLVQQICITTNKGTEIFMTYIQESFLKIVSEKYLRNYYYW